METPDSILDQMEAAYATCISYEDSASVLSSICGQGRTPHVRRAEFSTHFVRPNCFRFEHRECAPHDDFRARLMGEHRYVIWSDHGEVGSHWTVAPTNDTKLGGALSAAQGVTQRASQTIPAMLLPGVIRPGPLYDLRCDAVEIDESTFPEICYRLRGPAPLGTWTVWISRETFLLRRIHAFEDFTAASLARDQSRHERMLKNLFQRGEIARKEYTELSVRRPVSPFTSETTTSYHPRLNISIDESRFRRPLEL